MNSILLMGNGPSVQDHELGELIDTYSTVVRFNWYHIDGYEKNVGTKTDVWFTTVFDPVRSKEEYDIIYEHSWNWDRTTDKCYEKLAKARQKIDPDFNTPIVKTFPELCSEMCSFLNKARGSKIRLLNHQESSLKSWSTGAIAAWWFLNIKKRYPWATQTPIENPHLQVSDKFGWWDKVHLYGFDWWDMDSDSHHHLGDSQTIGSNHSPRQELEFFTYLWEMGKIHDLHPDSQFHYPPAPPDE